MAERDQGSDGVTLYTCLDAFVGPRDYIQRNAIWSWMELGVDIVLFGAEEPGAREVADALGLPIYPVERNEYGTPLLRSIISQGECLGGDVLCFVNSDIIIVGGLLESIEAAKAAFDEFMLSAPRRGLTIKGPLGFSDGWRERLWERANGVKPFKQGLDLFCYRGIRYADVEPGFIYARTKWDNWLAKNTLKRSVPFLWGDIFLVHHNIKDRGRRSSNVLEETKHNKRIGGMGCGFRKCTHMWSGGKWKPHRG
jgi:hypothetical protein